MNFDVQIHTADHMQTILIVVTFEGTKEVVKESAQYFHCGLWSYQAYRHKVLKLPSVKTFTTKLLKFGMREPPNQQLQVTYGNVVLWSSKTLLISSF